MPLTSVSGSPGPLAQIRLTRRPSDVGDVGRTDRGIRRQDEVEAGPGLGVGERQHGPETQARAERRWRRRGGYRCRRTGGRPLRRDVPEDDPQPRQAEADRAGDRGKDEEGGDGEDEPATHRAQAEAEPAASAGSRRSDVEGDDPGAREGGHVLAARLAARRRERQRRAQVAQCAAERLVRDRVERLPRLSHGSALRSRPRAVRGACPGLATASTSRSPAAARASRPPQPRTGRGSSAPR